MPWQESLYVPITQRTMLARTAAPGKGQLKAVEANLIEMCAKVQRPHLERHCTSLPNLYNKCDAYLEMTVDWSSHPKSCGFTTRYWWPPINLAVQLKKKKKEYHAHLY